jgi:AcrR family transcriptional regulator
MVAGLDRVKAQPEKLKVAPKAAKSAVPPKAKTVQKVTTTSADVPPVRARRKKSDIKRSAIVSAAAKIFKKKGYAEATLAEIGKAAGTFAGSLYYHFDSKDQIVEEVLNIGTTGVSDVVSAVVAALPAETSHREKIRAAMRAHLSQMLVKDDFVVAYWKIIDQVPAAIRKRHLQKPRGYGAFWKNLINEAVAGGEIRQGTDASLLRLVMIGSTIWALDWYKPRGRLSPAQLADSIVDMLFEGVKA